MNKKCLSCIHCEVCSFIDSDTAKLEACDFYTKGCEDAISREEVKELFQEACEMKMYDFLGIDDLPSVIPKGVTVTDFADKCRECGAKYGKLLKQEPCEDAISRRAVLDQTYLWSKDEFLRVTNPFDYLRKRINSLPSVKPQEPKWIPVSERLPEVNQRVLVTSYGRVCYAMMISADANSGHPVFKLQDSLNERVVCETTVYNEFTTSRIKAWMPLPEPYKAESEE